MTDKTPTEIAFSYPQSDWQKATERSRLMGVDDLPAKVNYVYWSPVEYGAHLQPRGRWRRWSHWRGLFYGKREPWQATVMFVLWLPAFALAWHVHDRVLIALSAFGLGANGQIAFGGDE